MRTYLNPSHSTFLPSLRFCSVMPAGRVWHLLPENWSIVYVVHPCNLSPGQASTLSSAMVAALLMIVAGAASEVGSDAVVESHAIGRR